MASRNIQFHHFAEGAENQMLKSYPPTDLHRCQSKIIILFFIYSTMLAGQDSFINRSITLTLSEKDLLAQGEIIVRDLSTDQKVGKTVEAIGLIKAGIDDVYQVLLNFEDYNEFMPNLAEVAIFKKGSNYAILNYTNELPLNKVKKYRLDMSYQKKKDEALLQWEMIKWPGLRESETINNTTGYWILKNYPDKQNHIIALYHVYSDPGPVPLGLGWIVDILTYNSAPKVVINTRARVYSLSSNRLK